MSTSFLTVSYKNLVVVHILFLFLRYLKVTTIVLFFFLLVRNIIVNDYLIKTNRTFFYETGVFENLIKFKSVLFMKLIIFVKLDKNIYTIKMHSNFVIKKYLL